MVGIKVVGVKCDESGNIDVADLQACVDLAVALVRRLDAPTVKSLTQYL